VTIKNDKTDMMLEFLKKYYSQVVLLLVIFALVIIKFPHLSLPYYGDEGFAFGPAVHLMYKTGPSLLPSGLDPEYSYGHPLLFHFLVSSWMKIFGPTIFVTKSFALLISVLLLISLYLAGKSFFNAETGLLAAILMFLQPMFLAQSSFVLLEIFLSLLALWTIWAFFKKRYFWYAIFGSMLVMTKESGLFLIFAICVWQIIDFILEGKRISIIGFFKKYAVILIPAFVFGGFLIIQKMTWGWFFFPLRMKETQLSPDVISHNLAIIRGIVFNLDGRIWLLVGLLISTIVYFFVARQKFSNLQWKIIWFVMLFTGIFWLASAFNFISNRYFLIIISTMVLVVGAVLVQAFEAKKRLFYPAALLLIFSQAIFAFHHDRNGDDSLGFEDPIIVQRDAIRFLEEMDAYNTHILTHFLINFNMQYPVAGYLSGDKIFDNTTGGFTEFVQLAVISNVELSPELDSLRSNPQLELLKRFERGNAWTEIYQRKK
jgi:4-amino-4-deoxy-L-arabinose transferase-like glycosyltransferase